MDDPREVQLILVECATDFADINFYFGGDDFALTVIYGNLLLAPTLARGHLIPPQRSPTTRQPTWLFLTTRALAVCSILSMARVSFAAGTPPPPPLF